MNAAHDLPGRRGVPLNGKKIRRWAKNNNVHLCFTLTNTAWANPIEAHFGPLRQFTLANSHHPNHTVQTRALHAYLRWRNANARPPTSWKPNAGNAPHPQRERHSLGRPTTRVASMTALPARSRTMSGAERHQEINHVALFHLLAGKEPAQPLTLIDEERMTGGLFRTRNADRLPMLARCMSSETVRLQRTCRRTTRSPVNPASRMASLSEGRTADLGLTPQWRAMRPCCSRIHGTSKAVVFHQIVSAPPASRTRNASGTDRPGSVHCQDCAYVMRSQEADANGRALPSPLTTGTPGSARRNSPAMASPGSTAITSAPRSRSSTLAIPVPAPTSATRAPAKPRPANSSMESKSSAG